ncbi:ABC transporter permease subunit [Pantoea sp. 1.19]|uniref:ABC transporter permease subunit n=1 Tax=Pantoea sp. 1.19 TaxID=1925589 RepID=UPI000948C5F8|nr:ABC transporter permease subunit [Pantoea sp. 1.19]
MDKHPIPASFSDRRRLLWDRLTRGLVTVSAVSVMLVMLLLFGWLLWVVLPLFASPTFSPSAANALPASLLPARVLGLDADQRTGWRIDNAGEGRFFSLPDGAIAAGQALSDRRPLRQVATNRDGSALALADADGRLHLVTVDLSQPAAPRWRFPFAPELTVPEVGRLRALALATGEGDRWTLAVSGERGSMLLRLRPGAAPQRQWLAEIPAERLLLTPDGQQLYLQQQQQLTLWHTGSGLPRLRERVALPRPPLALALLGGGASLLVADDQGISQWFDVPGSDGPQLTFIRRVAGTDGHRHLLVEPLRRVFATLSPAGELTLFSSKREGALAREALGTGISALRFSPHGDGLLLERAGQWQHYRVDNPWPDLSWRSLWQKVWYEHYPAPDWVWQSSAASDNYQAKFSLVPMVSGTLKAAGLALLFATPLALAAAIYTAWFMSPGLRRVVKPAMEMMGALPSVVVGLIAGLWLAPTLGDRLIGVLLLPVVLTLTLLGCAWCNARLPERWRQRPGREMLILIPLLLLVSGVTLWLVPMLTGEAFTARWRDGYEQRNLLVAGVAMGFALVPLIFTLAEDALFSVPVELSQASLALGATPWQTLVHVVLPGASAGIFAALMIGFGRAIGETMIVLMAAGNTPQTDGGLFHGLRTLAANVAIEMPEAAAGSAHYRVLFLSALVLLLFTLVVNTLAEWVRHGLRQRYQATGGRG